MVQPIEPNYLNELGVMQRMYHLHEEGLADRGITIELEQDRNARWRAFIERQRSVVARPLDPEVWDYGSNDAISIHAMVGAEEAGVICLRMLYRVKSLLCYAKSGAMWFPPREAINRHIEFLNPDFHDLSGDLSSQGGLYVKQKFRNLGIGWHLPRMIRWLGFMPPFEADAAFSNMMSEFSVGKKPEDYNGYARVAPVAENLEVLGQGHRPQTVRLLAVTRQEALSSVEGEIQGIHSRSQSVTMQLSQTRLSAAR